MINDILKDWVQQADVEKLRPGIGQDGDGMATVYLPQTGLLMII